MGNRIGKLSLRISLVVLLALTSLLSGCGAGNNSAADSADVIKVGVLFSLSGWASVTEKGMANAALLAIDEINANGGVKGKKLVPIQEDLASEPSVAVTKAKKLLSQDNVVAVVGGYTSASRQAMLPVFTDHHKILVYPSYYEGEECSNNVIYTGATPNQQLQEFIPWLVNNQGKKFFLVGSDHVYPVEINKQVKALLEMHGGEVIGEEYVPAGHSEFSSMINKIKNEKPDVIFSTLVGDSIASFYKQYHSYGLNPEEMPIASPVTAESEVASMGVEAAIGHLSSFTYFQSVDTPENQKFIKAYQDKFGDEEPITSVIEASYLSTHLLAQALDKAEDMNDFEQLANAFRGLEFNSPQGAVKVDDENNHTWLRPRIGKVGADGQFEILQEAKDSIHPEPWATAIFPDKIGICKLH